MLPDTADANLERHGLPVILACAVVQGWALYGLHHAVTGSHWPATNVALLLAFYAVAVFVPLTLQMLARNAELPLLWLILALLTVAFLGFGVHEGAFVHADVADAETTGRLGPLLFILLLLWLQILPFVQGRLAAGHWHFGYPLLFMKAWRNKLMLAEATLFTGLFWLLLFLWQKLFALLGIGYFEDLFREPVFIYPVTALIFGIALHLIGSIDRLTLAILDQLLDVLKWLGTLGAFILVIFSVALAVKLPGLLATGERAIGAQWLLWLVAVVVLLLNAAYRDGSDPAPYPAWLGRALRVAVPLLVVVSLTAVYALVLRTRQYGLTVERFWAFVVAGTALLHSTGYAWAALRRGPWMQGMARVNVLASLALMSVLALTLTPVLSPNRLAADSQFEAALAAAAPVVDGPYRSDDGWPDDGDTPIRWLRFRGGGYGLARLRDLASLESHPDAARIRSEAAVALAATDESDLVLTAWRAALDSLTIQPAGRDLEPGLRTAIETEVSSRKRRGDVEAWKPGTGGGVYLDLNDDGQEEFLVLFPRGSQLYSRTGSDWGYVGTLGPVTARGDWESTLADMAAGRFSAVDQPWNDVVIGDLRLRVHGDDEVVEGWVNTAVTPVTFELVDSQTGGPDDAATLAIRNSSEWETFWSTIEPRTSRQIGQQLPNPAPAVDFRAYTLLVAALGERAQPGHSVSIMAASDAGDEVIVDVLHTIMAGANCTFAGVITYPVSFARIPATTKAIVFRFRERTTGCPP